MPNDQPVQQNETAPQQIRQTMTYAVQLNSAGQPSAETIDAVAELAQQVIENPEAVSGIETAIVRGGQVSGSYMQVVVTY